MDLNDVDDDFQDAYETQPVPNSMDLETSMLEAKNAVNCFFNNKFDEARNILQPWADSSMYHAVGHSVFTFLEAMLTFEHQHIEKAAEALKQCMTVCNRYRRRNTISESIGKIVKKPNYDQYSPEEIHAELCYAEALLLKSLLTFVEDETLVSFIKAGIKIRSCYNSYKECANILNSRHWTNEAYKIHFESGVRMGIGAFNLMISLLPARVIKLLEFIGFSGNKELGLKELQAGYELHTSIRQVLCVMTLLSYHLIVVYVLSHSDGDLEFCDKILQSQLKLHPEGVWFLFFKGRLEFMKANIDESIHWYTASWKSQNMWPQFHHMCFWELMWTNSVKLNWRQAALYADNLIQQSRWSRTIYTYQKAAMLSMLEDSMTLEEKHQVEQCMRDAPQWKQRIAGKSLPMEKFAVKKTERFFAQEKHLILPALELMYVWNLFKVVGKKWKLMEALYKLIEKSEKQLMAAKGESEFFADNKGLILLLKGACLRLMNSPLQAKECLESVISLEKKIKEDMYLVPYAMVEIAVLHKEQNEITKAVQLAEDAKKNYTGYSLESRLHFRIHSLQTDLNIKKSSDDINT